jgi:hypothetical protein
MRGKASIEECGRQGGDVRWLISVIVKKMRIRNNGKEE